MSTAGHLTGTDQSYDSGGFEDSADGEGEDVCLVFQYVLQWVNEAVKFVLAQGLG